MISLKEKNMKQVYNPYLPSNEYIPDGEPHVFGDRIYVFGSHDREGGTTFCELDYVVYSAPVTDLTEWKCEGTIYRAKQDPHYCIVPDSCNVTFLFSMCDHWMFSICHSISNMRHMSIRKHTCDCCWIFSLWKKSLLIQSTRCDTYLPNGTICFYLDFFSTSLTVI